MKSELEKRNISVLQFKKRYPRIYRRIQETYGGKSNIFDMHSAIHLYLSDIKKPICKVCGSDVAITKNIRNKAEYRCAKHVNSINIVPIESIKEANKHGYKILHIPNNPTPSSKLNLRCDKHGDFTQTVKYFMGGGRCRGCYSENRSPRISRQKWENTVNKIFDKKYSYKKTIFKNMNDTATITCPDHGDFIQNVGLHYRGHGCPTCGYESTTQKLRITNEEFIEKCKNVHGDKYDYSKTNYVSILHSKITITCSIHGDFVQRPGDHLNNKNGCPACGFENTVGINKSSAEYEIIDFLKSLGIANIVHGSREYGIELDIFLPEHRLAIEFNGIYWHSSNNKAADKKKSKMHLNKTAICEENNISLMHIFENEWRDPIKQQIWKSVLMNKLALNNKKIYARKCTISKVSHVEAKTFLENNHLQGYASGSLNLGLYYKDTLVALGTFSKSRFRKQEDAFELLRFASKIEHSVVGGFSKIIKYFEKNNNGVLISYANRRWSQGKVYSLNGFVLTNTTPPCYYYTNTKKLWHRSVFQKHKLQKLLKDFDNKKSEVENMYENGYRRIWDCGTLVYERKLK